MVNQSNQPSESTFFVAGAEQEEVQRPLSSMASEFGDGATADPLAGISARKRFNTGSLVLVVVIVAGCGTLWFMKTLSKAGAASVDNSTVEASIEKFISALKEGPAGAGNSGAPGSRDANVLAVLNSSYTERQVPLSGVQRNPFILFDENSSDAGAVDADAALSKRQSDRRAQFEKASAKLELKSVLMSSQPLANISGKIVRAGDEIVPPGESVAFRVSKITKESATVIAEDAALDLNVPFTLYLKR